VNTAQTQSQTNNQAAQGKAFLYQAALTTAQTSAASSNTTAQNSVITAQSSLKTAQASPLPPMLRPKSVDLAQGTLKTPCIVDSRQA